MLAWMIITSSHEGAPLPTWDAEPPREEIPTLNEPREAPVQREAARVPSPPTALDDASSATSDWVDVAHMELAISGEWDRRYMVACTATAGEAIAHWQQGPYDAPGITEVVAVLLPIEVTLSRKDAVVSCRLDSARFDDSSPRTHGVDTLWLDGRTQTLQRLVRPPTLTTAEVK